MRALVLLKITSLETRGAYRLLKELSSVVESYLVYGRYDAAAILQADNLEEMRRTLFSEIQPLPGVIDILPCIIADDETAFLEPKLESSAVRKITS